MSNDDILDEYIAKETRIESLSPHISTQDVALLVGTPKSKARETSKAECFICHEIGHMAHQCRKMPDSTSLYCRYCKKDGNVIEQC